jgi:hypothetical protein
MKWCMAAHFFTAVTIQAELAPQGLSYSPCSAVQCTAVLANPFSTAQTQLSLIYLQVPCLP